MVQTTMASRAGTRFVRWFSDLGSDDVGSVGGKNASLGEMIRHLDASGVRVPRGFAVTVDGYWHFLDESGLRDRIVRELDAMGRGRQGLRKTGSAIRKLITDAPMPEGLASEIREAYGELGRIHSGEQVSVAVRSSATAEDLPGASFAGQQETYLNIVGEDALLRACRECFASLFTDRAISYRENKGFDHMEVGLSVGVQKMVRSDKACAGVMFSIDTETGFSRVVVIDGSWGLGETVVKGEVSPDAFVVFKPLLEEGRVPILERRKGSKRQKLVYAGKRAEEPTKLVDTPAKERDAWVLSDDEIVQLARWAVLIEEHYGIAMDMEWAKDGETGELYIVQARPETVQSQRESSVLTTFRLKQVPAPILTGLSIGEAIAVGPAKVIEDISEADDFREGDILVTDMTSPDWVPLMKRAAAIITDSGGRTSHAAIVSRELGVPAVVGTENATATLKGGQVVTVSCAEGSSGHVYDGEVEYDRQEVPLTDIPETKTAIMANIATPGGAFQWWRLPLDGIGLARMEFIINNAIKVHPMALLHLDEVEDKDERQQIEEMSRGYERRGDYFVDELAQGIARIAASQYPRDVIVRFSDFKTNEYAHLVGGAAFEPDEENPMLGFRGASRYYDERYREAFALECAAIRRVREEMGLTNVIPMVPFCRSVEEADRVLEVMADYGLVRGKEGLSVYLMCELPSNVVMAEEFAERFDGFSIGSNDLTQLVLGVDRDSGKLRQLFDERDRAVKRMIASVIATARERGTKIGICGQAPSDHPEFAEFLVECGIDSISVNPDSFLAVKRVVAQAEDRLRR